MKSTSTSAVPKFTATNTREHLHRHQYLRCLQSLLIGFYAVGGWSRLFAVPNAQQYKTTSSCSAVVNLHNLWSRFSEFSHASTLASLSPQPPRQQRSTYEPNFVLFASVGNDLPILDPRYWTASEARFSLVAFAVGGWGESDANVDEWRIR